MINTSNRNANNLYLSLNALNWNNGIFTAKNVLNNGTDFLSITDHVGTGISLLPFETKIILLDKSTDFEEMNIKTDFTIFPNPAQDNITILLNGIHLKPNYEVQIFNAVGKLVLIKSILSNETNSINIEFLSKGIYFIKLDNGNVKKWVKD
jgi:hypothetical protein